jgi:hypothetical protein
VHRPVDRLQRSHFPAALIMQATPHRPRAVGRFFRSSCSIGASNCESSVPFHGRFLSKRDKADEPRNRSRYLWPRMLSRQAWAAGTTGRPGAKVRLAWVEPCARPQPVFRPARSHARHGSFALHGGLRPELPGLNSPCQPVTARVFLRTQSGSNSLQRLSTKRRLSKR